MAKFRIETTVPMYKVYEVEADSLDDANKIYSEYFLNGRFSSEKTAPYPNFVSERLGSEEMNISDTEEIDEENSQAIKRDHYYVWLEPSNYLDMGHIFGCPDEDYAVGGVCSHKGVLVDENDIPMAFESLDDADAFLKGHGIPEEPYSLFNFHICFVWYDDFREYWHNNNLYQWNPMTIENWKAKYEIAKEHQNIREVD